MPWGRMEDDLHENDKVLSFSDKEFRVWAYSISFCNSKRARRPHDYDTLTEREALAVCRLANARPPMRVIAGLVEKRGWDSEGEGYRVHDLRTYAPKTDTTAAERQARHRTKAVVTPVTNEERHAPVTRDVTPPVPMPVPVPGPDPTTSEQPAEEPAVGEERTPSRARASAPPGRSVDDDFGEWWRAYPRRVNRQDALASYRRRRQAGRSAEALLAAARQFASYVDENAVENEFRPHAATFLNQKRDEEWEHGPPEPPRGGGTALAVRHGQKNGATVLERNLAALASITPRDER